MDWQGGSDTRTADGISVTQTTENWKSRLKTATEGAWRLPQCPPFLLLLFLLLLPSSNMQRTFWRPLDSLIPSLIASFSSKIAVDAIWLKRSWFWPGTNAGKLPKGKTFVWKIWFMLYLYIFYLPAPKKVVNPFIWNAFLLLLVLPSFMVSHATLKASSSARENFWHLPKGESFISFNNC